MAHISAELAEHSLVHPGYIGIHIGLFLVPFRDCGDDPLEVQEAVFAGLDGVVAQIFGLGARVSVTALAAEPEARILRQARNDNVVPVFVVFFYIVNIGWLVAELNGPFVVVADARVEACLANSVFRLRHVVEASVVHNGYGVAVLLNPFLVTEKFNRSLAAGAHIVPEAKGVANLV